MADGAALNRVAPSLFSAGFGLLMVASAAAGAPGARAVWAAAALIAVAAGIPYRPAATLAVLLVVLSVALSDPPILFVGLCGLCATGYLVCRHAVGPAALAMLGSRPTAVAAVGFTGAGLAATWFPLQLPWLPLAAPLGALLIYLLAVRPYLN